MVQKGNELHFSGNAKHNLFKVDNSIRICRTLNQHSCSIYSGSFVLPFILTQSPPSNSYFKLLSENMCY